MQAHGMPSNKIGGYTDHVPILCMLSKKTALMKLLEEVKSHSSKWFKTKADYLQNFYWQDARLNDAVGQGYGAFSVNPSEIDRVISYIANQKEHHATITFQDEYRAILKRYGMEYDVRYVWD